MSFSWLKLPLGIFEDPQTVPLLESREKKEIFLFYLFLLCHSAAHAGYLALDDGTPMPLSAVSVLFRKSRKKIKRYFRVLADIGLVRATDDGYYLPKAEKAVGKPVPVKRKEEEEKEIDRDQEKEKEKDTEREKAKAKESEKSPRYGTFDAEAVFSAKLARFQNEAERIGGGTVDNEDGRASG